jgi:hypothetical protein
MSLISGSLEDSQELILNSRYRLWVAQCSINSARETLLGSMERIQLSRKMIIQCDEHLRSYGCLISKP